MAVNSRIGSGAFASVCVTREGVVKQIHDVDDVLPQRLLTELAILRHLHHPHLIHALPTLPSRHGRDVHVPMEHGGTDLLQLLAAGCTGDPLLLSLHLTQQLLRGVEGLHRQGIVHCDIKPSNLLVQPGPVQYSY